MADVESIRGRLLAAKNQVYEAYDMALELHQLLAAFLELKEPPTWAFPLERMAERVRDQADRAHGAVLSLSAVVEPVLMDASKPAAEAGS